MSGIWLIVKWYIGTKIHAKLSYSGGQKFGCMRVGNIEERLLPCMVSDVLIRKIFLRLDGSRHCFALQALDNTSLIKVKYRHS